jgi:hypothetical protein
MTDLSPDAILASICAGRSHLLDMGRRFNAQVAESGTTLNNENLDELNGTVEAIFELEGIPLSDEEKLIIRQIDKLHWTDEQAIEFFQAMGSK